MKDCLELKELKWQNCIINSGSSEQLIDFLWSIHGNSMEELIKQMLNKKFDQKDMKNLLEEIIGALKFHLNILAKENYPEGQITASYMYMVVKRKPRNI